MLSSRKNNLVLAVVLLSGLAGCADYMNRRDSVTLGIGDAALSNAQIQTINPFPPGADNQDIMLP